MKRYIKKDGKILNGMHKHLENKHNNIILKIEEIPDVMDSKKQNKPNHRKKQ